MKFKFLVLLFLSLIFTMSWSNVWGQTTLFSDDFTASTGTLYDTDGAIGTSTVWSLSRSGVDWGAIINGGRLDLTNDAGATANVNGWVFGYRDINVLSGWNTTLSSNTGTITWEFNMRQIRTDPAGFGSGAYGVAFVLAGTSTTAATSGSGYAVVLGQSGTTDAIRLAHFNNGIQGTLTNLITSNTAGLTDFGTNYLSIRITYIPSSNTWELFLRNDNSTAFTDPTSGTALTSQGTAVNNTYTSTAGMRYIGGYWQGSTAATQTAFFDNVYLKKTEAATPTISSSDSPSAVNTTYGTASASPTSFNVSGANMSAGILVTPPAGFEVSTSTSSGFATSITVGAAGTIASTTVYVRLAATAAVGSYSGNIVLSSAGASDVNVATVSSSVSAKSLTVTALAQTKTEGTISETTGILNTHFTVSDLVSGDVANQVTLSYSGTPAGDLATATPGTYAITPSALTLSSGSTSNYSITYSTGTLTINAAATPTLSCSPLTAFGSVCINTTAGPNSFTITGSSLTAANVTVGSLTGYTFSTTSGGTYTSSLSLTQSGGAYSQTIFVKFTPTSATSFSGNIVVGGGGASNVNVAASGTGTSGTVAVTTTPASSITTTTASTGGSSVSSTCGTITAKGVAYGTSVNPSTPTTSNGTGTADFSSFLSGLTANTVYNYRAYVTNSNAVTSYGSNLTFTTLHNAPNIGSGSGATTTGFIANWSAPIGGGSAIYTYEVAVSTSSTFTSTLTTQSGISSASTSHQFSNLIAGTTYYFRVRANNEGGGSAWSAISTAISTQSVFENFETGTKPSYAAEDVTCLAGSWNLNDALIGNLANDRKFNSWSVRIRNTGIVSMNFDVTNGISSLTVHHALYGTDASSTWRLEVSTNSGSTWDAYVSSIITTTSTTLTAQTFNIDLCGSLRFRIIKLTGGSGRLNIDDIVLVEKAATPSAPTASPQNFCTVLSPVQVSDLTATGTAIQWYSAPTGGTALATSTALTTGTYYASQTLSGCESTTRASVAVSLSNIAPSITPTNGHLIWNGRTNTDFGTISNWYEYDGTTYLNASAAPSSSTNIIIPANESICVLQQPSMLTNGGNVKNLTIESGASLTMESGTLSVAGNWENNGTFTPGTGTVAFTGTANQSIVNSVGETFHKLTINKASGVVLLSNDVTIANELNLSNGILDLQASNLNMASNAIIGGSASSYVRTSGNGVLKRNVSSSPTLFPVGKSAYNPAVLTKSSGDDDLFSVRVYDYVSATGLEGGVQSSGQAVNRTWMINESLVGGNNVTLKMYWNAGEEVSGFVYSPGLMNVMHHNGSIWEELGATDQGESPYFIEKSGISSFSPFTIGYTGSPLPVEFLEFTAQCNESSETILNWSTATEHNSDYFKIEKSIDGINWSLLSTVAAAGNSTERIDYTIVDLEKSRGAYYKLWQYDFDGSENILALIHDDCSENFDDAQPVVYPNPTSTNAFTIQLNNNKAELVKVEIYSLQGQLVYSQTLEATYEFTISDLTLERGIYKMTIQQEAKEAKSLKICIQ